VAAGLLLAFSLPAALPWTGIDGLWPLAVAGAALLYACLHGGGWRRRLAVGMGAGLGLYVPGLWWMADFSLPGYVAATLLEAAILAAAVALVPPDGRRRLMAFPAALVLAEAVRGAWPFGGVPLTGVDLGQVAGPFGPAARLGGRLLLVALVGLAGAALAELASMARARPRPPLRHLAPAAAALAAVAAASGAGSVAPDGTAAGALRVAAVQGGGTRGVRAVDRPPPPVVNAHLRATAGLAPGAVDLVLLPEDVIDVEGPMAGSPEDAAVADVARRLGTTVVAGVVEDVGEDRFRNAAVAWDRTGTRVDRYDKVHRVPFGEYVPARSVVDRLADLSVIPRDAIAGHGPGVLDTPAGRMGVVISFEVFFPDRARGAVRAGGQLLLVPTNASSYRTDQVPAQEVAAARLRALETGRWVVQAAPTGYSAIVDHRGRVVALSALGRAEVLQGDVGRRTGQTLAARLGSAPIVVLAVVALAASTAPRRKVEHGNITFPGTLERVDVRRNDATQEGSAC
jgi:apolipoprotein N-acyltransferase